MHRCTSICIVNQAFVEHTDNSANPFEEGIEQLPVAMSVSTIVLPGQPLPSKYLAAPQPYPGPGCYSHAGQILASIVGVPKRDGSVSHVRPILPLLLVNHSNRQA